MRNVLVFDLDDTLYPEHEFVKSGFRAVADDLQAQGLISSDEFLKATTKWYEQGPRQYVFNHALEEVGIPPTQELIARLVEVYREHQPNLTLHEDAIWALETFRGHAKLGLLTDGFLSTQQKKVQALGLVDTFDAIVYSDQFGRSHWKPSPKPYQQIMQELLCDGTSAVYVGDNPTKDFVTARQLGWLTIQVQRPQGVYANVQTEASYQADLILSSLFELQNVKELIAR